MLAKPLRLHKGGRNILVLLLISWSDGIAPKLLCLCLYSKLLDRVVSVEYALRDDDERDERYDSPRRGGHGRRGDSPYGRSPSPKYRRRPSPDYGRAQSPVYDRYNGPAYDRRKSPEYGRHRSPDHGRYRR